MNAKNISNPENQNTDQHSPSYNKYPKNPTWCPGCGNYAIWGALKIALLGMCAEFYLEYKKIREEKKQNQTPQKDWILY